MQRGKNYIHATGKELGRNISPSERRLSEAIDCLSAHNTIFLVVPIYYTLIEEWVSVYRSVKHCNGLKHLLLEVDYVSTTLFRHSQSILTIWSGVYRRDCAGLSEPANPRALNLPTPSLKIYFRNIFIMDGWMTCDFTSFLTVFQSYQDDVWMIMKGCVQWNSVYGWEDFTSTEDRTRSARSVGQRLTHWATGAPIFIMRHIEWMRHVRER